VNSRVPVAAQSELEKDELKLKIFEYETRIASLEDVLAARPGLNASGASNNSLATTPSNTLPIANQGSTAMDILSKTTTMVDTAGTSLR